jgi:GT2 family glycosyltransferase
MNPAVSVLIVNWNGLAHLPDCLESLAAQTFRNFEVILVDNGSEDGSVSFVRDSYPRVKLLSLDKNTGFAGGNNYGLKHASGNYIVTLNNDTRAEPDWLKTLVAVADAHPRAGMIGSRICSFFEPDLIDSIGMGICRDGMSRGRFRNKRWSELSFSALEEILFPSACAALYRREMLEEIGFFDEDFFAYAEDSDLGLRGRLAGWQALAATRAVVYHKYSQTGGSLSPFKVYHVERNHYWVAAKNFPLSKIMLLPFSTALRYFEQGRAVLQGIGTGSEFRAGGSQKELVIALLKAIRDSVVGIPQILRKRRAVMTSRKLPKAEFLRLLHQHRISFKELLDND